MWRPCGLASRPCVHVKAQHAGGSLPLPGLWCLSGKLKKLGHLQDAENPEMHLCYTRVCRARCML